MITNGLKIEKNIIHTPTFRTKLSTPQTYDGFARVQAKLLNNMKIHFLNL